MTEKQNERKAFLHKRNVIVLAHSEFFLILIFSFVFHFSRSKKQLDRHA